MAVPNTLVVTDAGYAPANGTYTRGADINGFPAWYNDECNIERQEVDGKAIWAFRIVVDDLPTQQIYSTAFGPPFLWPPANTVPESPVGLTFQVANSPGTEPVPVVAAGVDAPSSPTFGLPTETVALIISRFGTVANFLRLRNQGQV